MDYCYKFSAVRGRQAGKEYYIAMVPMRLLTRLFIMDSDDVLPEFRAQRRLNEQRIPEIRDYILENKETYVFSALAASIDGEFQFQAVENMDVGVLEVNMDAVFLINDGQHRKAAIEAAIKEWDALGEETISVVFFEDQGLVRSQQMFSDLNKHAVKTSNSISTLYESREEIAVLTKRVLKEIRLLDKYTDKEKDNLGSNSSKLFTLHNFYKANQRILRHADETRDQFTFLFEYWSNICLNMNEWNEIDRKELSKKDLRENYVTSLGVTILVLGRLGAWFYENPQENMAERLKKLQTLDWTRSNKDWLGRMIREDNHIMNNENAIILTCNYLKTFLGIKLSKEEIQKENHNSLKRGKKKNG